MAKKKTTKKKSAKKTPASASSKKKSAKKTTKKKTAAKSPAKKSPARKSAAKKTPKKKLTKKKVTKKKTTKKTTKNKSSKKTSAKKPAKKPAKKSTTKTTAKSAASNKKTTRTPAVSRADAAPAEPTAQERLEQDMAKEWTIPQLKRVKTGLKKKDLNELLQLLLEKRAEIIGNVQGMEDARNAALGDIAHMPLHMADVGSDNYEQEFTLGLMESEREMLREIEEALVRMREGYYGVCLESGRPIDRMRLEFAPWAKYCIEVARLREKRGW